MTQNELNQTGYIIEGFRATPITYGDYLREYWSDETTTPNGIAPRLFVAEIEHGDEYIITDRDDIYNSREEAEDAANADGIPLSRIISHTGMTYEVRSWGVNGSGPSRLLETFDNKEEAELAICARWEYHYYNDSTDAPTFVDTLAEAAEMLAERTNRPIAVVHRYWAFCAIADTRNEEARKLSDLKKEVLKHAIEVEAAELVPDSILLEDLRASNDLKGEERTKARSAAQVAFLLRVNHYPIRTDFWKVFKIVNAKKLQY